MATSETLKTGTLPSSTVQPAMAPKPQQSKLKDTMVSFVIGGIAACGAVTFTNPWEVRKDAKPGFTQESTVGSVTKGGIAMCIVVGGQDSATAAR